MSAEQVVEITGQPFNDAYRYMDWLLTVPLLLIEIIFVMKLSPEETASKATSLGVASGLMIILGYPGELIIDGDLNKRWMWWALAMVPFLYVVQTLLVGLQGAIQSESDPAVAEKLSMVCWATVISWCTYPVVYVFPMFGFSGPEAVVAIQLGYCVSDIVSKCGVGFLICKPITITLLPCAVATTHTCTLPFVWQTTSPLKSRTPCLVLSNHMSRRSADHQAFHHASLGPVDS